MMCVRFTKNEDLVPLDLRYNTEFTILLVTYSNTSLSAFIKFFN